MISPRAFLSNNPNRCASKSVMRPRRLSSIPAPESAPHSRSRLQTLGRAIEEVRAAIPEAGRDDEAVPSTMPSAGWERHAAILTEVAVHHVVLEEPDLARQVANEALSLVDLVESPTLRGELSLVLGEVLLESGEPERARARFEVAMGVFDDRGLRGAAARARVGLARAMARVKDPAARAVLEDAGTAFEDDGDDAAARAVDVELRALAADLGAGPASFIGARYPRPR